MGRVIELFEKDLESDIDAAESIIKTAAERHATTDGGMAMQHFLMAFNGCGQTDGVPGTLFAVGLKRQCRAVVSYIDFIIDHFVNKALKEARVKIKLNVVGLSRGGIAAMFLCQLLSNSRRGKAYKRNTSRYDPSFLSINALLFDPVPGNLVSTSKIFDCCNFFPSISLSDIYFNNMI